MSDQEERHPAAVAEEASRREQARRRDTRDEILTIFAFLLLMTLAVIGAVTVLRWIW